MLYILFLCACTQPSRPAATPDTGDPADTAGGADTADTAREEPPAPGELVWKVAIGGLVHADSAPLLIDGMLVFAVIGDSSAIVAVDPNSGAELWRTEVSDAAGLTYAEGVLVGGCAAGKMCTFDPASGEQLTVMGPGGGSENPLSLAAVSQGLVLFGDTEYKFYAYDATTGAEAWRFEAGYEWVWGDPVVYDGAVFFAAYRDSGSAVYAVELASGEGRWSVQGGDVSLARPGVAAGGWVCLGADHGDGGWFAALDPSDGSERWRFSEDEMYGVPVLDSSTIYVGTGWADPGSDGRLVALDATTGSLTWEVPAESYILSPPAVAGGIVYASSSYDHHLYAVDATTGDLLWSFRSGSPGGPVVVGDLVVFGCEQDQLCAVQAGRP